MKFHRLQKQTCGRVQSSASRMNKTNCLISSKKFLKSSGITLAAIKNQKSSILVSEVIRSSSSLACFLAAAYLAACTTSQPVPVVFKVQRSRMAHLGRVGVTTFSGTAKGELILDTGGRSAATAAAGAVVGAALGAATAATMMSEGSCSGRICGAYVALFPIFVGIGATLGGTVGAVSGGPTHAITDDKAAQIEEKLRVALADVGTQEMFQSKVLEAAARSNVRGVRAVAVEKNTNEGVVDYRSAPGLDIDTVLEVGVVRVGLIGTGGEDPQLALRVDAVARLVDVQTNEEFYLNYPFTHFALSRKYSEWTAHNERLLKRELGRAYESLGTAIVHDVFLVIYSN